MVEDMVYEFLDKYVGKGINISDGARMYDPNDFMPVNIYFVYSDNETRIIQIRYKEDNPSIVYEQRLGDVISSFFSISKISSHGYISSWFKERNGIESLWDLKKFIDNHEAVPSDRLVGVF
jgi:hypothetical protein